MSKKGQTIWPSDRDFGRRVGIWEGANGNNVGRQPKGWSRSGEKARSKGGKLGGKVAQEGGQWGILIDALGRGGILRL